MIESFIYNMAGSVILITIGAIMWRMMLEGMDKRNGKSFRDTIYPQIKQIHTD